jgi:hypothetical protein
LLDQIISVLHEVVLEEWLEWWWEAVHVHFQLDEASLVDLVDRGTEEVALGVGVARSNVYRCGLAIVGCQGFRIFDVTISDTGGDGLYVEVERCRGRKMSRKDVVST